MGFKGLPPQSAYLSSERKKSTLENIDCRVVVSSQHQPTVTVVAAFSFEARKSSLFHTFTDTAEECLKCQVRALSDILFEGFSHIFSVTQSDLNSRYVLFRMKPQLLMQVEGLYPGVL